MNEQKLLEMGDFAKTILAQRYAWTKGDGTKESMQEVGQRVAKAVLKSVDAKKSLIDEVARLIGLRIFIPGGRYLFASGRPYHQVQNCVALRAEDSREGWATIMHNASMSLMTGAGIGVNYSAIRAKGKPIRKTGGVATGPLALLGMVNEAGRGIRQGGTRRSAIFGCLSWRHPDIFEFITSKNWSKEVSALKEKDYDFPATLDGTNISVSLDDEFFKAYRDERHSLHAMANNVYWATIRQMLKTGEPGFTIDVGKHSEENLRNACGELCTADDSDVCNLGSINMARIESLDQMRRVVEVATAFLLAGTVYSDVPYPKVDAVRTKNRRLGLGLMGIHEWLLTHGKKYSPDDELEGYLKVYRDVTDAAAAQYADTWELSHPVAKRAIAPNGTVGILAETSTGCEPLLYVAYKRLYMKGDARAWQYVIDPAAKRLIEMGANPDDLEDAYTLAETPERRVAFQAWLQQYVDHGISSTINLPAWGSELNNESRVQEFGNMFMAYLPKLRGITVYPDGARGGQPLQAVSYRTAMKHSGKEFTLETGDVCDLAHSGTCNL
jgi:ribonucleoside-diphosphate reductase alpha chain